MMQKNTAALVLVVDVLVKDEGCVLYLVVLALPEDRRGL